MKAGWKLDKLENLLSFKYGEGNQNPGASFNGKYPVYGANGIIGAYDKYNGEHSIIIGHMGAYAGSVLWEPKKFFATYNGTITTAKNENLIDIKFMYYLLNQMNISKICSGSGMPFLAYDQLNNIEVYYPIDIQEQRKISDILTNVDNLMEYLQKLISKKEKIKYGIMEEYLTGKKVLNKYSGQIQKRKITDILESIVDNRGKTPPTTKNGIPLIEVGALSNIEIDYSKIEKYVSEETFNHWFRNHLKHHDLLFSTVGSTALSSLYDEKIKASIAQNIIGLRFKNVSKEYMGYLFNLKEIKDYIRKIEMSAVQPSIKVSQMIELEIPIHIDKKEQEALARILRNMDEEISSLNLKLKKYKKIKEGMLEELLTGKVRVIYE